MSRERANDQQRKRKRTPGAATAAEKKAFDRYLTVDLDAIRKELKGLSSDELYALRADVYKKIATFLRKTCGLTKKQVDAQIQGNLCAIGAAGEYPQSFCDFHNTDAPHYTTPWDSLLIVFADEISIAGCREDDVDLSTFSRPRGRP